jgi:hypothetical protein
MSGSMVPGPPVRTASPGYYLRFALIIAMGFLWNTVNPQSMPGQPIRPSEEMKDEVKERHCIFGHLADIRQSDGTYTCKLGHEAWESEE